MARRTLILALLLLSPACIPADAAPRCGVPHKPPCPTTTPRPTTTLPTPPAPSKRIAVLLINFADDLRQPWTPAFIDSLYDGPPTSVSDFYNRSIGLTVSADVFGWFTIATTTAQCPSSQNALSDQADAAAIAAGVDLSLYTNRQYFWPANAVSGCRSGGQQPGTRSWVAMPTSCNQATGICAARTIPAHEFGHNLGYAHASAWNCAGVVLSTSCVHSEYGDSFDVMGSGYGLLSNLNRLRFGAIPSTQVVDVTNATITVTPLNNPTSLVYRIPYGSDFIYIENRAERTVYENGPGTWNGGMLLFRVGPDYTVQTLGAWPGSHLLDGSPESNTNPGARGLPVGASFTTPTGVTITNLSFDGVNNTVQVASP